MNLGDCHQRSRHLKPGITFDRDNIIGKQLTISLVLKQQAADELRGNHLGRASEEGLGEVLGGRGGYGSDLGSGLKR